jgi:hypothetical protein
VRAAVVAFTASFWLCYMESAWQRVRIVVLAEVVRTILATVVMLWVVLFDGRATMELANAVILGGFAAAFTLFYFRR